MFIFPSHINLHRYLYRFSAIEIMTCNKKANGRLKTRNFSHSTYQPTVSSLHRFKPHSYLGTLLQCQTRTQSYKQYFQHFKRSDWLCQNIQPIRLIKCIFIPRIGHWSNNLATVSTSSTL